MARNVPLPDGMADSKARHGIAPRPFWPFSVRAAVVSIPVVFAVLVIAAIVLRQRTGWPAGGSDGELLLGMVLLSFVPIALVLLGSIAGGGGSVEAFGVKIRWREAIATHGATVPPRLGLSEQLPMRDSGTIEILGTLREATRHDVVVVDLEEGRAWWETRLLVLAAGAARLGSPSAIVFVATEGGVRGWFQGWARPRDVLSGLLSARADLRAAYDRGVAVANRWALAVPDPAGATSTLPWGADPVADGKAWAALPPGGERNPLAPEQIIADEVGQLEVPAPSGITIVRLRELLAPCLRIRHVDEAADADAWSAAVLSSEEPFVAVTRDGRYVGLVPRERAVNEILRAVITH
jgi:hypothetical protein